jgi:hypothetical protein
MALTATQRRLLKELEEISFRMAMDWWNIERFKPGDRTMRLAMTKNQLVRGQIIMTYAFFDELLSLLIANYYFANMPLRGKRKFPPWHIKKFRLFLPSCVGWAVFVTEACLSARN